MNEITKRTIDAYKNYLVEEEKCPVTIEKYIRDITAFINWTEGNELTKTLVLEYKNILTQEYAPASVNSVLSSLNGYFNYIERYDLKVKNLKVQRQIFCQSEKELTKFNSLWYMLIQHQFRREFRVASIKHQKPEIQKTELCKPLNTAEKMVEKKTMASELQNRVPKVRVLVPLPRRSKIPFASTFFVKKSSAAVHFILSYKSKNFFLILT